LSAGQGGVTMPGKGKSILGPYSPEERAAIEQGAETLGLSTQEAFAQLGDQAVDVYLNDVAYWKCVPEEVREVMRMGRRIAGILLLQPALDANYLAVKGDTWEWKTPG
jgi:hypothetical protein